MFHVKHIDHLLQTLTRRFSALTNFKKLLTQFSTRESLSLTGISGSAVSLFITWLYHQEKRNYLLVFSDSSAAENVRNDLDQLLGEATVAFLPDLQASAPQIFSEFSINNFFLNDALKKLRSEHPTVIVAQADALDVSFVDPQFAKDNMIHLEKDQPFSRDELLSRLTNFGYQSRDVVVNPLDLAARGSIIDLFPPDRTDPVRVEFFDDYIASIRSFNVEDQLTLSRFNQLALSPPLTEAVVQQHSCSLFSYLNATTCLCFCYQESLQSLTEGEFFERPDFQGFKRLFFNLYLSADFAFDFRQPVLRKHDLAFIKSQLAVSTTKGVFSHHNFIVSPTQNQIERLKQLFGDLKPTYIQGRLSESVSMPLANMVVYADHDLFGRELIQKPFRRLPQDFNVEKFDVHTVEIDDLMVHINYGIGKYKGLNQVEVFGSKHECLVLEYKESAKVFVPFDKLKDVRKYRAPEGRLPQITKLGSGSWEKKKLKTKRSVEKTINELVALYAQRKKIKGFAFSEDNELQIQMESEFMYTETPDQVRATREIKTDMQAPPPMDRLLCGDVGFGKTEVALRAAFKAISDSKQVAVLVPTTILADQHYHTFHQRLRHYPVNIGLLSRFVSRKIQRQTTDDLAAGKLDIVIGTHRLLSRDISFCDLGLLIIDEEHRFGVTSKEKLKSLRLHVDVLSLTATPIPRTLHFSLIGARDFSQINTPPKYRLPIVTEVITYSEKYIQSVIYREIQRNGQVYFVHNEIKTIAKTTAKLQAMFPELVISYVHGRMKEGDLEPIMRAFINHKIDVLVTTAIIESGIDIPNVNTIIINRAQRFGLAQLYQLRGRVGRSNRRAYCYLIVPQPGKMNQNAVKRLKTIKRYTSLGSGYDIALKDLEIRGAGNLFGLEQSGNIAAVGYDLYTQILNSRLQDVHADQEVLHRETKAEQVDIITPYDAYLPTDFIPLESVRLHYYRRLSEAQRSAEIERIGQELQDRFGTQIPAETINLLAVSHIRCQAHGLGITKVLIKKENILFVFCEILPVANTTDMFNAIQQAARSADVNYKFLPARDFRLIIFSDAENKLSAVKLFLDKLQQQINLCGFNKTKGEV